MVTVRDIILLLALAAFLIWFDTSPARGACVLSYCKSKATTTQTRTYITNTHRQIVGDLYDPGTGRVQIRDTSRRIVGYVERSGRVTNTHHQKIGEINGQ